MKHYLPILIILSFFLLQSCNNCDNQEKEITSLINDLNTCDDKRAELVTVLEEKGNLILRLSEEKASLTHTNQVSSDNLRKSHSENNALRSKLQSKSELLVTVSEDLRIEKDRVQALRDSLEAKINLIAELNQAQIDLTLNYYISTKLGIDTLYANALLNKSIFEATINDSVINGEWNCENPLFNETVQFSWGKAIGQAELIEQFILNN